MYNIFLSYWTKLFRPRTGGTAS